MMGAKEQCQNHHRAAPLESGMGIKEEEMGIIWDLYNLALQARRAALILEDICHASNKQR